MRGVHIETLKVFCDVVESGSFSVAASQNFITQSAVSQQLRTLESKYHCKLLERGRSGAKPTPAGEILYRASREILEKYREIDTKLQETGKVVSGSLRVAIVYSVGLHELPPYMKEYLLEFPQVNVHIEYSRPNKIYDDAIAGRVDLGIVAYPVKHPQVTMIPFREDRLVVVCPSSHAFSSLRKVTVDRLDGEAFVGYERDISTRKATDEFLKGHGVAVRYVGEYDNIETIKRAVEIGQGIAIIPLASVQHELEHGTLKVVHLSDETLLRPLGIIHKKGRHLSPAAMKFIEVLRRKDLLELRDQ
ncbi:MAG TPA: LysR family transcriptional regulator [Candidatus Acidoferrales bacterium]|nr:LysR family transcriptional regulator [Candidatus Acidoferrales bacterium]